jgi:hypothetical protein
MVEQEVVRQMRALAEAGWGVKRIAREVGVARNTVRRSLLACCVPCRFLLGPHAERVLLTPGRCGPPDAYPAHHSSTITTQPNSRWAACAISQRNHPTHPERATSD